MNEKLPIRIGHAYDFHRLVEGRKLILGGIQIPSPLGLLGHSDADCLTHALSDAILGAMALPDIGHYFPDTEEKCKGMNSKIILEKAIKEIEQLSYRIGNVDLTIIAEKPKIAPFCDEIKNSLSQTLKVETSMIGLKATTNEKVGPVGRLEGIAAFAVCTLILF